MRLPGFGTVKDDSVNWTKTMTSDSSASGGYELVIAPLLLGLLGFWLDGVIGIRPALTIAFTALAFAGVVIKLYYGYKSAMAAERARKVSAP